jgi:drug/metabolite transporter (DMT)-like permease
MVIVYALLAALCNALNVITQHLASTSGGGRGWQFVRYLLRNPLWLAGWVALAGGFIFQALALHFGQLSVVQPLLVTELVFALLLRRFWIGQPIRSVTWWAAVVTCAGLAAFVGTAEPQGGKAFPAAHEWLTAVGGTVALAALLALLGLRGPATRRAAFLASATAVMWALVAVFIKSFTLSLTQFGVLGLFKHWPVYALAASGLVTELLQQATLHVGPLSVSQPLLVIVDPVASIVLSVVIFKEYFTENALRLTLGSAGFVAMCLAVAVLTRTAPRTMAAPEQPAKPAVRSTG